MRILPAGYCVSEHSLFEDRESEANVILSDILSQNDTVMNSLHQGSGRFSVIAPQHLRLSQLQELPSPQLLLEDMWQITDSDLTEGELKTDGHQSCHDPNSGRDQSLSPSISFNETLVPKLMRLLFSLTSVLIKILRARQLIVETRREFRLLTIAMNLAKYVCAKNSKSETCRLTNDIESYLKLSRLTRQSVLRECEILTRASQALQKAVDALSKEIEKRHEDNIEYRDILDALRSPIEPFYASIKEESGFLTNNIDSETMENIKKICKSNVFFNALHNHKVAKNKLELLLEKSNESANRTLHTKRCLEECSGTIQLIPVVKDVNDFIDLCLKSLRPRIVHSIARSELHYKKLENILRKLVKAVPPSVIDQCFNSMNCENRNK